MEERRFDALTRTLGAATSRRGLLKGAIGGVLASVFAFRQRANNVDAASVCEGATRDPSAIRICEKDAWYVFSERMKICHGEGYGGSKAGGIGALFGCTVQAELNLADQLRACRTEPVCPTGNACCGGRCCPADEWCCPQWTGSSWGVACVDRQTDPENCGGCGNHCDPGKICQDGQCVCPPTTTTCSGVWGSDICCHADEECGVNALLLPICVPKCKKCEEYDATTKTCKPKECGICQVCDDDTGQCVNGDDGTSCGSGLSCCGGQCQDANKTCGGKGGDCPICQEYDVNDQCVPKTDGVSCGACGKCSSGSCVPDPNRACADCFTCSESGVCMPADDLTSCDGGVCCGGTCTPGETCPCPDGKHQCTGITGDPICCANAVQCCIDQNEHAMCGPSNDVCCSDNTYQCGAVCCDASEVCGIGPGAPTGKCCPNGTRLVADGSCCADAQVCDTADGSVWCAVNQSCVYNDASGYWQCVA